MSTRKTMFDSTFPNSFCVKLLIICLQIRQNRFRPADFAPYIYHDGAFVCLQMNCLCHYSSIMPIIYVILIILKFQTREQSEIKRVKKILQQFDVYMILWNKIRCSQLTSVQSRVAIMLLKFVISQLAMYEFEISQMSLLL